MKRGALVLALATVALAVGLVVTAAAAAHGGPGYRERGGRALYFAIGCGFSHRNSDDAIVYPRQPGVSHDHTYFGNESTDAFSTPASLRGSGTSCALRADTAAYWVPTLFVGGQAVEPRGAVAYYVRRTVDHVRPFPAGLKIIAGNAAASSAQSQRVTYWTCGRSGFRASTVPTCSEGRRSGLRLVVNFPNCWNGRSLDSADHEPHDVLGRGRVPRVASGRGAGDLARRPLPGLGRRQRSARIRRSAVGARRLRQRLESGRTCCPGQPIPQPGAVAARSTEGEGALAASSPPYGSGLRSA